MADAGGIVEAKKAIAAQTSELAVARRFLLETLERTPMPEKDSRAVVLAVDEALANTMEHGYGKADEGTIELDVHCDGHRFCITILDHAKEYDSASRVNSSEIDMTQHVDAGKRRGLGLFIMRKVMDEVRYAYRDGKSNELTLVKYIKPEGEQES